MVWCDASRPTRFLKVPNEDLLVAMDSHKNVGVTTVTPFLSRRAIPHGGKGKQELFVPGLMPEA